MRQQIGNSAPVIFECEVQVERRSEIFGNLFRGSLIVEEHYLKLIGTN